MSDAMLLVIAVFVFTMMLIGLVLTIVEFSRGEPKRQAEAARARQAGKTPSTPD